jgi:CRISPR-associated endonuclease Csn1
MIVSFKNRVKVITKPKNRYSKYVQNENGQWVKTYADQGSSKVDKEPWLSIRQPLHKETIAGSFKIREYKDVTVKEAILNVDYIAEKYIKNKIKELLITHYTITERQTPYLNF